jgi:hypothetical protein
MSCGYLNSSIYNSGISWLTYVGQLFGKKMIYSIVTSVDTEYPEGRLGNHLDILPNEKI